MRLLKRGDIYYVRYWSGGRRISKSTKLSDRRAAEAKGREWEREAADPDHTRTRGATLNDAFGLLLDGREEQVRAGRRSEHTVDFYRTKAGHWLRLLGHNFPLSEINARVVRDYITARRSETSNEPITPEEAAKRNAAGEREKDGRRIKPRAPKHTSDHTISKELVALRAALRLAVEDGCWKGDPKSVIPVAFAPDYKPRERWATDEELAKLLGTMEPHQAARLAFIVATSAEWGATERALRADVAKDHSRVLVRGTKRPTRWRHVPIVSEWQASLLKYAMKHAGGTTALFAPWGSPQQTLEWACKRVSIERVTPNDLRRTFAQWMRRDGVPLELCAPMMGHKTTAMLQRVYGRLDTDTLEARVRASLEWTTNGPPGNGTGAVSAGFRNPRKSTQVRGKTQKQRGGSSGGRTPDQRIKSPLRLWPEPRRKPLEMRSPMVRGPLMDHPSASGKRGPA